MNVASSTFIKAWWESMAEQFNGVSTPAPLCFDLGKLGDLHTEQSDCFPKARARVWLWGLSARDPFQGDFGVTANEYMRPRGIALQLPGERPERGNNDADFCGVVRVPLAEVVLLKLSC